MPTASEALTPRELALLACYVDGTLAAGDVEAVGNLLARSEAAREVVAESAALLERTPPAGDRPAPPGGPGADEERHDPAESATAGPGPTPRMGWRSFLPLAAAGVAVIFLLWPGGEALNLLAWSDSLVRQGDGDPFAFPVLRGDPTSDDVAETAGIRWVDLRIALRGGETAEADSLARALVESLGAVTGSGAARGRVQALTEGQQAPTVDEVESAQHALVERFGSPFVEAAVLETLRRAAGAGATDLAEELVDHPSLDDGEGEDLDAATRERLEELCDGSLTADELAEMETIVTEVLRRRT